ncbi:MAG: DUF885 domain-containing protein, partial [Phycisphaerales bacterium]|nr:DUF885 domain-containing protein [Phycisphaerales bacterium]
MKRFLFFVVFLVMSIGSGCAGVSGGEFKRNAPKADDAAACDPIFQLYWDEQLRRGPEWGTYLADHRYDDQLSDYSPFARRVAETMDVRMLSMVRAAIPEVADDEQRLNLQLLERILAERVELAAFPGELMPVKQQESPHLTLGMLHTYHPFKSPQECLNYATRLRAFDRQVDQLIDLMNEGVRRGIVRPRITIEQTLPQIEAMITTDPTTSALYEPAKTLSAEAGGESSRAAIEEATRDAMVALTRLRDYLKNTYLPACRDSVGICHLPDGRRWYRVLARHHTTTDLTPEAIHQLGLDELARTHERMRAIMKEVDFEGSLQDFIRHMRNDPAQHNRSAEEIMRRHRENLAISDANLPKLFGRLPKTPYELKEMEAFRAAGAPAGYYYNAPDDGSRPAFFYVNTFAPETRPIYTMEALAYHEAQPGHHLQLALSQERRDWPAFRRFEYINAFIEGWALYSERLGYELGGYRDPYSRFGQLTYDTWRSARLVVDTGMHYFGWSREKAIEFMKENTGLSEQNIVSEVDRYIAWPGQALAYKIGQLEILRLRAEAEQALGDKFDIRAFHD